MALTTQQKLDLLKHLGRTQVDPSLDTTLVQLALDATRQSELVAAITNANSALAAIVTAENDSGKIASGGGATFNYRQRISIRKQTYDRYVKDLVRITGAPALTDDRSGGQSYNWALGV